MKKKIIQFFKKYHIHWWKYDKEISIKRTCRLCDKVEHNMVIIWFNAGKWPPLFDNWK